MRCIKQSSGPITGAGIRLRASLHKRLRRPFFLLMRVIYRALCCAISVVCANSCAPKHGHHYWFHAIVHRSSPSPPLKHRCGESFYSRIGDKKTKVALRRVLHRVFRPRPHRLHTMNGGVFAVPIARSYPITTVQFLVTGGFVTCPWGSEVSRCTQRGLFEATAGECDELDTTSCQMA